MKVAVLGAGSWGTTFAKILLDAGAQVAMWARRAELADQINTSHANPQYLPGVSLPARLLVSADPAQVLSGADVVALAVPSQTLRDNLVCWRHLLPRRAMYVSLAKGIELGTLKRMTEVICEAGGLRGDQVAVLSGPNLAPEIAQGQPTATVIACPDPVRGRALQAACTTSYFRPYTNTDVVGVELCGSVKNVIALACGMAFGMGFGNNTLASLITRGLAETSRLGLALGADPLTFAGLAGLGDLVGTCSSPLSRNRTFGERLGRGESLEQAQLATHGQVAEGVLTSRAILELAEREIVDMPIVREVEAVCYRNSSPRLAVRNLMSRETKSE